MSHKALGIYREPEFSPGKVEADAAILDATLAELKHEGIDIQTMDAVSFAAGAPPRADLVLPMCQGPHALNRLASVEQAGAIAINSASAEICMHSRPKTCSAPPIARRSKRFSPTSHSAEFASRTCSRKSSAAS